MAGGTVSSYCRVVFSMTGQGAKCNKYGTVVIRIGASFLIIYFVRKCSGRCLSSPHVRWPLMYLNIFAWLKLKLLRHIYSISYVLWYISVTCLFSYQIQSCVWFVVSYMFRLFFCSVLGLHLHICVALIVLIFVHVRGDNDMLSSRLPLKSW